jgi:microcystin-dependent protein/N-acetylneuraminic acid mutarotase
LAAFDAVFIDSRVPDIADLIAGAKPGVEVFVIDPSQGLAQVASILQTNNLTDLHSISLVGFGDPGKFFLGSTVLDDAALSSESTTLKAIARNLAVSASSGFINLYASNVASGAAGGQFLSDLSGIVHVPIYAATHSIGAGSAGTWGLDAAAGTTAMLADTPFTDTALASVAGVLDATVLAGATATFDGGGPPVPLDPTLEVVGPNRDGLLTGAKVIMFGGIPGDTLGIGGKSAGVFAHITYSFNANTLTLSGTDTVADYQAALQSVTYDFAQSNADPTAGGTATSRSFSWFTESAGNGTDLAVTAATPIANDQPTLGVNQVLVTQGLPPGRDTTVSDPGGLPIGAIRTLAGSGVPTNTVAADGQLLPTSGNGALFSLLGINYGGDGSSTFALPNLQGTLAVGSESFNVGGVSGADQVTLTARNMPADIGGSAQPFSNDQPGLQINYLINVGGLDPATHGGSTDILGEIVPFAGNFAPTGYMFANGQLLPVAEFPALAALLGTTYGGDGQATFALPDLTGRTIIGASSQNPLGTAIGQDQATVTDSTLLGGLVGSNYQPSLALNYIIAIQGAAPGTAAAPGQPMLGEIVAIAGNVIPQGWALANGAILSVSQNLNLFAAIGNAYGGNGATTFALPDLTNRTVAGIGTSPAGTTVSLGQQYGSADIALAADNLPIPSSTLNVVHTGPSLILGGNTSYDFGLGFSEPKLRIEPGLIVSDPDSGGFLTGATITFSAQVDDPAAQLGIGGQTSGTIQNPGGTISYSGGGHTLSLSGTDTIADYQAALRSVTFSGNPPNGFLFGSIGWSVSDGVQIGSGSTSFDEQHAWPQIVLDPLPAFVSGSGPVVLDPNLALVDVDGATSVLNLGDNHPPGELFAFKVYIGSPLAGDVLEINGSTHGTLDNGTISYSFAGSVLTLSGEDSFAAYQAALRSVEYAFTTPGGDPTGGGSRTVTSINWQFFDTFAGDTQTQPVPFTLVHSLLPVITAGGSATFTGGGPAVALNPGVTVTDLDSGGNLAGATVSIGGYVFGDTLNFTNTAKISASYDGNQGVLTLTGTDTIANYETALDSVTYSFSQPNGDPTAGGTSTSRVIDWNVNDGAAINDIPGTSSLGFIHTRPTVTANASVTYEIGQSTPVLLDPGLTVADVDSDNTLVGATVRLFGFDSRDTLTFANTANITGSYSSSTGILTLSGTDTLSDYQGALESVGFSTTDPQGNRGLDVGWTVDDGSTSNGTNGPAESILSVKTGLSLAAGGSVTFAAGGPSITLDGNLRLSDAAASIESATVSITGAVTGDTLTLGGQTSGTLDNNHITFAFAGSTLTLTGADTATAYQNTLAAVRYSFTPANGDPTAGGTDRSRTIDWTATDGVETATVTSTLVTQAQPTLAVGATAAFTEGGGPVALSSSVAVSDPDSPGLAGATIVVAGSTFAGDGDVLAANTSGTSITASYNSTTETLVLSGTDTFADYQSVLETVTFNSTSLNPADFGSRPARTVAWSVSDGTLHSVVQTTTVAITAVNSPPTLGGTGIASFVENGPPVSLAPTASVSDPDSLTLARATVAITGGTFAGDGDLLAVVTTGTSIAASYNSATETLTLTGGDTLADYTQVLDSVTFATPNPNARNFGSDPTRTVTWTLDDGSASNATSVVTSTISISDFPPTLAGVAVTATLGPHATLTLSPNVTVSDPDDASLASATVAVTGGALPGDLLAASTAGTGISASYNSTTETLTLTGSDTLANYQQVLDSVTFTSTSANPNVRGADRTRTLTWTLNDGVATSTPQTETVSVLVAPTLAVAAGATYVVGRSPVTLSPAVTLSDSNLPPLSWTTEGSSSLAAVQDAVALSGGKVYEFDASGAPAGRVAVYDPAANAWSTISVAGLAAVPDPGSAVDALGRIYLIGGAGSSSTSAVRFDPSTGILTQLAAMPGAFGGGVAAVTGADGRIYIFGGSNNNTTATTNAQVYDPGTNTWSAIASLPLGVTDGSAVVDGTLIYLVPGLMFSQNGTVQVYDTVHNTWSQIAAEPTTVVEPVAGLVDGKLVVAGGVHGTSQTTLTQIYDPATGTWTSGPALPTAASSAGRGLISDGSQLFVVGGGAGMVQHFGHDVPMLASATVAITGGAFTGDGDVLSINGQTSGVIGAANAITLAYDSAAEILTLTGTDTLADYQQVLASVAFASTNPDPTNSGADPIRTVTWTVNDGGASASVTSTIATDEPPTLTVAGSATVDLQATLTLSPDVTVSDPDNLTLVGATVAITAGAFAGDGDNLTVNIASTAIRANYDKVTETLTLTGSDTLAHYQQVLDTVAFSSTNSNDIDTTRTVTWTVSDGTASSSPQTETVSIVAAPTLSVAAHATYAAGLAPVTLSPSLTVSDPNLAWTTTTVSSVGLEFGAADLIGGKLDVFDGLALFTYDPATNKWSRDFDVSFPEAVPASAVDAQGRMYLIGSDDFSDQSAEVMRIDPSGGSTTQVASLPVTVNGLAAATGADGRIYVFGGGAGDNRTSITNAEVYDPSSNSWSAIAPLLLATQGAMAVADGTLIYVIGGFADNADTVNAIQVYDTVHNSWSLGASLPIGVGWGEAGLVDGKIVVAGGITAGNYVDATQIYDPATNTWAAGLPMPTPTGFAFSGLVADGSQLFVAGGVNNQGLLGNLQQLAPVELASASVAITGGTFAGDGDVLSVNGRTGGTLSVDGLHTIALSYDTASETLTLTGADTPADYQRVLENVTFASTSPDPTDFGSAPARTVTWTISDGLGLSASRAETVTVDAGLTLGVAPSAAFTEGPGRTTLSPAVTLSDFNPGPLSWATQGSSFLASFQDAVELSGGKLYEFDGTEAPAGRVGVYDPATDAWSTISLAGLAAVPDPGSAVDALGRIYLIGGAGSSTTAAVRFDPSTGILTQLAAMPGAFDGGVAAVTGADGRIYVFGGSNNNTTATTNAQVYDPGTNTWSAIASLPLGVTDGSAVVDGTLIYLVPGDMFSQNGTVQVYDTVHDTWSQIAAEPTTVRDPVAGLVDGKLVVVGGLHGASQTTVTQIYDPATGTWTSGPALPTATSSSGRGLISDGSQLFVVGGGPAIVQHLGHDVPMLASATVAITGGTFAGDGDFLAVNGLTRGLVGAANAITLSYDTAAEILTLTGTDTLADYQQVLESITFQSSSPNPTDFGSAPTRTVTWTVTDDSTAGFSTTTATSTINITAVNNPPTISGLATSVAFTEKAGPVALSGGATVFDPDSLTLASATVAIVAGRLTGDALAANTSGTSITATYISVTGTLLLLGTDTIADYQSVLDSVTFNSPSLNPTNFGADPTRTVVWTLNDGSASHAVTTTIGVTAVDDPPTLSGVAPSVNFTEGPNPIGLSSAVTVTDPDNLGLAGATVAITGGTFAGDGDVLAAVTTGTAITASYNSSTETLTLAGSDTLGHYQQVLDSVKFSSNNNPDDYGSNPTRTVIWTLNDGSATSTPATTTIHVTAINNPPTLTGAPASVSFTEKAGPLTIASTAAVSDPDSLTLASATVAITGVAVQNGVFTNGPGGGGLATGDLLSANTAGTSITASYNSTTETLVLTGVDTVADYQAVLDSVAFDSTSLNPTNFGISTLRALTWTLNDGGATNATTTATTTLTITAVNDPPTLSNLVTTVTTIPNAIVTLSPHVTVSDPDDVNLASATVAVTGGTFAGDGDILAATNQGFANVTINYDPATETLTFTGVGIQPSQLSAILDHVTFETTATDPGNGGLDPTRTISWTVDDGHTISHATTQITAVDFNQGPGIAPASSAIYVERGAAATLSPSVDLVDNNRSTLTGATVAITGGSFAGDEVLAATTTGTSITATYNSTTETLVLSGTDTLADYQQVLQHVTFSEPGQHNPTNFGSNPGRQITWTVDDGAATNNSFTATSTLTIFTVDDPPTLGNLPTVAAFTENGPAVKLAPSVALTDPDDLTLTVVGIHVVGGTFAGDGDVLTADTTGTGITASYNSTTEFLTLRGASSDTLAHYQQVIDSVTFSASGDNPTNFGSAPTRTLFWDVVDPGGAQLTTFTTVSITAINDPPTLGVTAAATFVEKGAPVVLSQNVTVTDPDNFAFPSATVAVTGGTFAGDGDLLLFQNATSGGGSFNDGGAVTYAYDAATETLVVTALNNQVSAADYVRFLSGIQFSSSSLNPTDFGSAPTRTLTWTLNDGSASNALGTATTTVTITPVNDPPTLSGLTTASFTEAGSSATPLSPSLTVSDPDNLTLASATVAITGGTFAGDGDVLGFSTAGTSITATYNSTSETLTLSGSDTLAHYTQVLDAVTFTTPSHNPDDYGSAPTRTVVWTLNDGSSSAAVTSSVDITAVNDPPTLTVPAAVGYTEKGTPVALAPIVSVTDPDSLSLASATLAITGGTFAGDGDQILFFTGPTTGGSASGSGSLNDGGAVSYTYDAATETFVLSSTNNKVSPADVVRLLSGLQFSSTSLNPTDFGSAPTRTVVWTLNDGSASNATTTVTTTVSITAVNDPPTLTGTNASVSFTEKGGAVALSGGAVLSDPDSLTLSATVAVVAGGFAGDVLAASTSGTAITASYNSATETLVLSGTDTAAHYTQVLDTVSFNSTSLNPTDFGSDTTRTIAWSVNDGSGASNATASATETVNVTAVNDPPTLTNVAAAAAFHIAHTITVSPHLTVSDPDNLTLASATAQITGGTFAGDADVLAANTSGTAIAAVYDSTSETLTLSGSDTLAHYQQVLDSLTFSSGINPTNSDINLNPTRTLTWTANDGAGSNSLGTATTTISIAPTVKNDFNGDQVSDLLFQDIATSGGGRGRGGDPAAGTPEMIMVNGMTASSIATLANPGTAWRIAATGDFNADGDADIVWQSTDGTPMLWTMNGTTMTSTTTLANPGSSWRLAATGDFNNDGNADLLFQNTDGTPMVWTMNGKSVATSALLPDPGSSWKLIGTGDFDGDGKSDIVFQNTDGTPQVWLMNGPTVTGAALLPDPGASWHLVGTGDFNGDGKSDLLFQNTDGTPQIWTMNGTSVASTATLSDPGSAWKAIGTGDFNGDGKADILFQSSDGTPMVWAMNATTVSATATLPSPGANWHASTG